MNILRLSSRMLARDWRAGELRALAAALVIAVASVTTVGFFAERVKQGLTRQGNQLLGADLIIAADRPLGVDYERQARAQGLQTSRSLKFPSMVAADGRSVLSEVKAVNTGYPLRGRIRIVTSPEGPVADATGIPVPGTVWVDDRLLNQLELRLGDALQIGNTRLRIAARVVQEPDMTIRFLSLGPRLIVNLDDLPATGLVQPGSRISYRLMVAGAAGTVDAFRGWIQPRLARGEHLEAIGDARPEMKAALERAEKYLGLASLVTVVLAAAAVALAARRFMLRHLDGCAMMRCLGASQADILKLYLYHFLAVGAAASATGCAIGYLGQEALAWLLRPLVGEALPQPGLAPSAQGFLAGLALLVGFALPPVMNLRQVSTLRVMRREIGPPRAFGIAGYGAGYAMVAGLVFWKANEFNLGLIVLIGFTLAMGAFGGLAWLAVRISVGARRGAGGAWRLGLAALSRRAAGSVIQTVALALGIMALLSLTLIRGELLRNWRETLPPQAPNRFLVSIQPDQLGALEGFFRRHEVPQPPVFPMVRGRLVAINERPVSPSDYPDPRARRLAEREFNLSWGEVLQTDNRIVQGEWFAPTDRGRALLSVEQGIAQTLGIALGDTLSYDVAGARFSAKVASLRHVDWDTFRVNFFVIAPPGLLEGYPVSYVTSFHLPAQRNAVMTELVKAFPNFLVIDVAAIIAQVQTVMDQVTRAVEFVFLFTVAAGVVVLYAAIAATQDERVHEAAVYRTLGASRRQLILAHGAEFVVLGLLSGLLAAAGATALGHVLASEVLHVAYRGNTSVWWVGVVAGMVGVTLAGLVGTRAARNAPPVATLQESG
ncbi:MAG: ABC transporter permease [Betaproteobacteria bacterium]|nr:ABC transporter permease [Betaproteobacteria bacterium]